MLYGRFFLHLLIQTRAIEVEAPRTPPPLNFAPILRWCLPSHTHPPIAQKRRTACLPVRAHTALRRSGAYQRFPELLLDHPNATERAFRALLLNGIAVRDSDEWEDHHLTSVASLGSTGDGLSSAGTGRGGDGGGGDAGVSERALAGLGGQGCRLAEVDGSAVAIVEVIFGPLGWCVVPNLLYCPCPLCFFFPRVVSSPSRRSRFSFCALFVPGSAPSPLAQPARFSHGKGFPDEAVVFGMARVGVRMLSVHLL